MERKLLLGDILAIRRNNTPASSVHFKRGGRKGSGGGESWSWLWTRDHTESWGLKRNKWTQTPGQLDDSAGPPSASTTTTSQHPFFFIIKKPIPNLQEFSGLEWKRAARSPRLSCERPAEQKPGSALYTRGEGAYNDSGVVTDLTVSSWVSRVVRPRLVIIEHCQKNILANFNWVGVQ